jgi:VIT1/CCC1 family predicted Fe2+/Mn2+ transporter
MTSSANRIAVIMGSADGVTLAVSVIASLMHKQASIWNAGFGDGLGELVGMFAALYLTTDGGGTGFWPAVACGFASLAACALPCLPFLFGSGPGAFAAAVAIAVAIGAVISYLRPEKGIGAIAVTYGVLAGASVLAYLGSFT